MAEYIDEIQQFTLQCVEYLDNVLEQIEALGDDVYLLDDSNLAAFKVRKAQPLDIDEHLVDFGPRFFSPRFTLEEAREKTAAFLAHHPDEGASWPERCRRGSEIAPFWDRENTYDPDERHPLCTPQQCAKFRQTWFLKAMGIYYHRQGVPSNLSMFHGSEWDYVEDVWLAPEHRLNLPGQTGGSLIMSPPRAYTFWSRFALLLEDLFDIQPHIGAIVLDAAESGVDDVLRSEVAVAIGLLKYQIRRGYFLQHLILPSIVISFQHDRFGRINQFHFDGQSLVMRRSRLLDFRSDEPTDDAYHMMRWIEVRPIGDTRFGDTVPEEQEALERRNDRDTDDGKLRIDVRGA